MTRHLEPVLLDDLIDGPHLWSSPLTSFLRESGVVLDLEPVDSERTVWQFEPLDD